MNGQCFNLDNGYYMLDDNPRPCNGCALRSGCKQHCALFDMYLEAAQDTASKRRYLAMLETGEGRGVFRIPAIEMIYRACQEISGSFKNAGARAAYEKLYGKALADKTTNSYLRKLVAAGKLRKLSDFEYELV